MLGGGAEGTRAVLPPWVTPPLLPRKNWSSSWTVLEGGILTFFKDSKHSAAGALVRAPTASVGGQHPWDGASTSGVGPALVRWDQHSLHRTSTHGTRPAPLGWGQHPLDRTSTHGMRPAHIK